MHISGEVDVGHFLSQCQVRYQNSSFRCQHESDTDSPMGIIDERNVNTLVLRLLKPCGQMRSPNGAKREQRKDLGKISLEGSVAVSAEQRSHHGRC